MPKKYDQTYFDHWYRGAQRVNAPAEVRRKVALAISVAEYFLRRPIRSVLDVGCGEGAWFPHLNALRNGIEYMGVDPSEYVVRRFGKKRNIHRAGFGELGSLHIARKFDLIVCSDVLHYVEKNEIREGIAEIVRLLNGVAFIEVLTKEDDITGDLQGLIPRPGRWYRDTFAHSGLIEVAPYCFLAPSLFAIASELDVPHP